MPFTVSHVAAVLPLRGPVARRSLPTAALVIGSMAPDLPMFLGHHSLRAFTHTGLGVVTVDVLITVACGLFWARGLRVVVHDLVPGLGAAARTSAAAPSDAGTWSALSWAVRWLLAAAVGSATHVVWDSFTHLDGAVVQRFPDLAQPVGDLPLCSWLQYASSVLGLVVLAAAAALWWRREQPYVRWAPACLVLVAVLSAGLVAGLRRGLAAATGMDGFARWQEVLGLGAFSGGTAVLAALVVLALVWPALRPLPVRRTEPASVRSRIGTRG